MSGFFFPKEWALGLGSVDELAWRLNLTTRDLQNIERTIPRRYSVVVVYRRGKERKVVAPDGKLKSIQKLILENLLNIRFPAYVQGGVRGYSIVTNARLHRQQKWVARIDIRKFFPSVHYLRIKGLFEKLGCSNEAAQVLTHFTTYKGELPQGAPTSPVLGNLVLFEADRRLYNLAQRRHLMYTRYFDDITISGHKRLGSICQKVFDICRTEGFKAHKTAPKFSITPNSEPQIVTGLIVNGKRLKVSGDFLEGLEEKLDLLQKGEVPSEELYKFLHATRGMVAYLRSVDQKTARRLSQKSRSILWGRYGF